MASAMQRSWTSRHYAVGSFAKRSPQLITPRDRTESDVPQENAPIAILQTLPSPRLQPRQHAVVETSRPPPKDLANPLSEKSPKRRVKKRVPAPAVRKKSFVRPSLSSQLAKIGAEASEITQQLTKTFGPVAGSSAGQSSGPDATLLFQAPAQSFVVGKLASKFPSIVQFYTNRCEYQFHHPYQAAQIHMIMYYRDMDDATLDTSQWTLRFRIPRHLFHYGDDYDHRNARHAVEVILSSEHDTRRVAAERARFPGGLRILRKRAGSSF